MRQFMSNTCAFLAYAGILLFLLKGSVTSPHELQTLRASSRGMWSRVILEHTILALPMLPSPRVNYPGSFYPWSQESFLCFKWLILILGQLQMLVLWRYLCQLFLKWGFCRSANVSIHGLCDFKLCADTEIGALGEVFFHHPYPLAILQLIDHLWFGQKVSLATPSKKKNLYSI